MLNQMVLLGVAICTYFIGYTEGTDGNKAYNLVQ